MTLEEKLRRVDSAIGDSADRVMPLKALEERMLKFKRECE